MNSAAPLPVRLSIRRPRRAALLVGVALTALALGAAGNLYLGAGPKPITVTDAQGAATFNFRVTGIPVPGQVGGVKPNLTFDARHLAGTRGTVTVDLNTLNTGIALRDEHAKNFLGVKAHPQTVFVLNRLSGVSALRPGETRQATVSGTLDLNGVTVPLSAPATLAYLADGSAISVKTTFNVSFKDHHIAIPGADPQTDVNVAFRLPVQN